MFAKIRRLLADALDDSRFVIQIGDGTVQVTKGKVPDAFLRELGRLALEENLTSGTLRGKQMETFVRLTFSPEIPECLHQRLRNIWHVYEPQRRI